MKRFVLGIVLALCSSQGYAAIKACGELKSEIAAKLDVLGVKSYELTIAAKGEAVAGKVVGSCENSSKKITYAKQMIKGAAVRKAEPEQNSSSAAPPEVAAAVALAAMPKAASAIKPCKELKAEIAAKLDAAGVKFYELNIVENGKAGKGKIVGSCENSSKKITYAKKSQAAQRD